jgi:hypothetical protein
MRAKYPEERGPGSRPFLVILDFLQIIGAENDANGRPLDLRERIGRAAYLARDIAMRLNAIVLVISSTARDKYGLIADACETAGLTCDEDDSGRPVNRNVLRPDTLIGLGKETGEIEYSADSISVIVKVPNTQKPDRSFDVLFVTPKGRATGATWSPLHFTTTRYREAEDGGSVTWAAMREAVTAREARRAEKRQAKEAAKKAEKTAKLDADARMVAAYVLAHPGCTFTDAKKSTVGNNFRRWQQVVEWLGVAFRPPCSIDPAKLKPEHRPGGQS